MTSPTAVGYPKSTNWQDFERLCRALLSEVLGKQFQRWGRHGQRQDGADAWVMLDCGKAIVLQCKGRDQNLGKALTTAELDTAVHAANTFPHEIEEIIVLTTASDDKNLHDHASYLTTQRVQAGLSRVSVWGWNTICDHIGCHEKIQKAFFGYWFRRFTIKQRLTLTAVTILLAGAIISGILSFHESRQENHQRRSESVKELQRFVNLVDDLDSAYRECEKAMVGDMFLFTASLKQTCTVPAGERISAIEKQIEKVTPYLDEDAWREISDLTKLMLDDHRQALIAVEMTGFFENEVIRGLTSLCAPAHSPDFLNQSNEQARKAGHDAMVSQLHYYFVLRDFVRPGLSAMKARTLAQARRVAGESVPSELVDQANALATILKERQACQFQAPDEPFTLSVAKNRFSRNIKIQGIGSTDFVEQARWREVFMGALTKVFYGRPKDIERLISCGVFKVEARSLAEKI